MFGAVVIPGSPSTYVHPEGEFSLHYPSTWIVGDYTDDPLMGFVTFYDEDDWAVQVTIWELGSIPFIDTQSEMDRYHGTMGGEILTCTMATVLIDGFTCKDFQPNEQHGFITVPSGQIVHATSYTSIRQYDPETTTGEEVLVQTSLGDFICCTNHVYSMQIDRDAMKIAGYSLAQQDELLAIQAAMFQSFSFSTTPYNPLVSGSSDPYDGLTASVSDLAGWNVETTQPAYSYEPTHVSNFPDTTKSPQHYLDRYNNEDAYRQWFDSQFPDRTIYDVLGIPEPLQPDPEPVVNKIPEWVKNIFTWYSQDQISEDEVLNAIKFLVNQGIINLDE